MQEVFRIVAGMRGEGMSVLLVEQNVRASLEIADQAFVLDHGVMAWSGTAAELAADEERIQSLAGASAEEWRFEDALTAEESVALSSPDGGGGVGRRAGSPPSESLCYCIAKGDMGPASEYRERGNVEPCAICVGEEFPWC